MAVSPDLLEIFRARDVAVRVARTLEATEEFNRLQASGRRVVAALHLTC